MPDITKTFFLARDLTGPNPYRGANHLPLPTNPHELLLRGFRPGDGKKLQDFLTGELPTGEPKPRKLPREIANQVAHHINLHRHNDRIAEPGYVLQLVAAGEPKIQWILEIASVKEGRNVPQHKPEIHNAIERYQHGEKIVFQSELDNLLINHWERTIHYSINVITFDSVGDMDVWLERYGPSILASKELHRIEPIQEPKPATPWFEMMNWQRLPEEIVNRMDSGAKELAFPSNLQMARHALHAAPGPIVLQPFTFLWELIKEHGEHGPHHCVHTQFKADIHVVLCEGRV